MSKNTLSCTLQIHFSFQKLFIVCIVYSCLFSHFNDVTLAITKLQLNISAWLTLHFEQHGQNSSPVLQC